MPAVSKQQQRLFGLALSVKDGDTPRSKVSDDVLSIVDSMSKKEIEKYAGTKHKGLPSKVESKLRELIKQEIINLSEQVFELEDTEEGEREAQVITKALQKFKNNLSDAVAILAKSLEGAHALHDGDGGMNSDAFNDALLLALERIIQKELNIEIFKNNILEGPVGNFNK